jgi:hypothetical protein
MGPGVPPLALDFNPFRVADPFIIIPPTAFLNRGERASRHGPKAGSGSFQSGSNPCGIPPTIQNSLNMYNTLYDNIVDGIREARCKQAVPSRSYRVNPAEKLERIYIGRQRI